MFYSAFKLSFSGTVFFMLMCIRFFVTCLPTVRVIIPSAPVRNQIPVTAITYHTRSLTLRVGLAPIFILSEFAAWPLLPLILAKLVVYGVFPQFVLAALAPANISRVGEV